jgi:DNA-binding response OmpR family regulator
MSEYRSVETKPPENRYVHPKFTYFPERASILVGGEEIPLTARQNVLLKLFTESPNRIIGFEEIDNSVGRKYPNFHTRVTVSRLRKKLGSPALPRENSIIKAVSMVGYQLVDPTKL